MKAKVVSVAVLTSVQFANSICSAQTAREIDIAGVRLGSPIVDASAAVNRLEGAIAKENTGTLSLQKYTSPALKFGMHAKLGTNALNNIDVLYDLHQPQTVIAIAREQIFLEGAMPTMDYIHNTLIEKYGKPLFESTPEQRRHVMLWNVGAQMAFRGGNLAGSDLRFSDCTGLITQSAGGNALSSGNYQLTIGSVAATCGTWVKAEFYPPPTNASLVREYYLRAADLPRVKASRDYIYKTLDDGNAATARQDNNSAANVKPKL